MEKKKILASVIAILALATIAIAYAPLSPPPVNQNLAIYDTQMANLNGTLCKQCHTTGGTVYDPASVPKSGYGVPDRHHLLTGPTPKINPATGQAYGCQDCHPVRTYPNNGTQYVLIDRNCVNCHNGTAWYENTAKVNVSRPHHNTTWATSAPPDCKACHGSYINNETDGHVIPTYSPSLVTPYTGYKVQNTTAPYKKWGGCESCHEASLSAIPVIDDNPTTHHNIGKLYTNNQCTTCHGSPPNQTTDIRTCEKCHGYQSLHNIQYNYSGTNGVQGWGHIGTNYDCNGCHAWYVAGDVAPGTGAIIPEVSSITPTKLSANVATVVTITGSNLLQDGYTTVVTVDAVALTPTSVTDTEILVTVPGQATGTHNIQVVKGDQQSRLNNLIAVPLVDIVTAKVKVKNGIITITGTGFGTTPDATYINQGLLGVFVQKGTNAPVKAIIQNWSDTTIVAKLSGTKVGDKVTVKALYGEDIQTLVNG